MNFFKDLKEDIGNAVGNLTSGDNQTGENNSNINDDFDPYNIYEDELGNENVNDIFEQTIQTDELAPVKEENYAANNYSETVFEDGYTEPEYNSSTYETTYTETPEYTETTSETPYVEEQYTSETVETPYVEPEYIPETAQEVSEVDTVFEDNITSNESNLVKGHLGAEETVTIQKSDDNFDLSENANKTTVISKGTVINGSIVSDSSLEVFGTVNGDISCLGKLSISGTVKGKSSAAEVCLNTNRLEGGITSKGSVTIGAGTVVIGDIAAASCVVAGAVRGDLDVNGPVVVDSTAVIKGNINAKGIQVNSGAVIDGFCALPYASVDIDSYFGGEA